MPRKHPHIAKRAEPPEADDLKLINGIGPAVVTRLNGVGIFTFAQLAAMSPADLAAAVADLTGLTAERIIRQNWIGQARALAAQSLSSNLEMDAEPLEGSQNESILTAESLRSDEPAANPQANEPIMVEPQSEANIPAGIQNSEQFMVELFLDENDNLQSTHLVHMQSKDEDTWAAWQGSRLLDFIAHHLKKNPIQEEPDAVDLTVPVAELTPPIPIRLSDMEIVLGESQGRHGTLSNGQSFDMHLVLDLTDFSLAEEEPLSYTATIYGKQLESRTRLLVGEGHGPITPDNGVSIHVACTAPPPGTYHLEAALALIRKRAGKEATDLSTQTKGGLLHVH